MPDSGQPRGAPRNAKPASTPIPAPQTIEYRIHRPRRWTETAPAALVVAMIGLAAAVFADGWGVGFFVTVWGAVVLLGFPALAALLYYFVGSRTDCALRVGPTRVQYASDWDLPYSKIEAVEMEGDTLQLDTDEGEIRVKHFAAPQLAAQAADMIRQRL